MPTPEAGQLPSDSPSFTLAPCSSSGHFLPGPRSSLHSVYIHIPLASSSLRPNGLQAELCLHFRPALHQPGNHPASSLPFTHIHSRLSCQGSGFGYWNPKKGSKCHPVLQISKLVWHTQSHHSYFLNSVFYKESDNGGPNSHNCYEGQRADSVLVYLKDRPCNTGIFRTQGKTDLNSPKQDVMG